MRWVHWAQHNKEEARGAMVALSLTISCIFTCEVIMWLTMYLGPPPSLFDYVFVYLGLWLMFWIATFSMFEYALELEEGP